MREVRPSEFYQRMSVEDQIEFDRWLKANAVVASIFTAAVDAMAFVGGHNRNRQCKHGRHQDSFEK